MWRRGLAGSGPATSCSLAHRVSRIFITGGTGVIGRALVTRLLQRGDEVVALARSDASSAVLAARGAEIVRGEGYDEDALARGMAGCTQAFNVAGVNS